MKNKTSLSFIYTSKKTELQQAIATARQILDEAIEKNSQPYSILCKKKNFLNQIESFVTASDAYLGQLVSNQSDHLQELIQYAQADEILDYPIELSPTYRYSTDQNKREAARTYSISKAKHDYPDLF